MSTAEVPTINKQREILLCDIYKKVTQSFMIEVALRDTSSERILATFLLLLLFAHMNVELSIAKCVAAVQSVVQQDMNCDMKYSPNKYCTEQVAADVSHMMVAVIQ